MCAVARRIRVAQAGQREYSKEERSVAHREPFPGPAGVKAENFSLRYTPARADLWRMGARESPAWCVLSGQGKGGESGTVSGESPFARGARQADRSGGPKGLGTSHVQCPAILVWKLRGPAWLHAPRVTMGRTETCQKAVLIPFQRSWLKGQRAMPSGVEW